MQPFRISGFDPPPARVFAWRVLDLKEQGVSEDDAMAVADVIPSLRLPFFGS
jgi:small subunit ribosomal protein S23